LPTTSANAGGNYFNAVVELATDLDPSTLLDGLLALELGHGRARGDRHAARTLDLDLLLQLEGSRSLQLASDRLTLPHPRACVRDFVLAPLVELAPELVIDGMRIDERLAALPSEQRTIVRRLEDSVLEQA